jgi:quercetin dioxygenase-like cupin family protein
MKKILAGMWVENERMGQRTLVVRLPAETGGSSYVIEYFCQPFKGKGAQPIHYHLFYTEHFEILAGNARYQLGKQELTAPAGSRVTLPPGIPHLHPWSDSSEVLHVRQTVEANPPDLSGLNACINTGITLCGLAQDGKVGKDGLPGLLQLAVSAQSTFPGTYSPGLSISAQRVIVGLLALIGRTAGYRTSYPDYGAV